MATKTMSYFPKQSLGQGQQAGVALIAVLLFLILITIAGVIAVRQSSVDLKVATSDQANALMMNASDSVLADIEQTSQPDHKNYVRMLSERDGILGYFGVQTNDKIGDQLHFCYRPNSEHLFSLLEARILKRGGGYDRENAPGLAKAICDSEEPNDYVSSRNTTMTQVAIRALDSETRDPFQVNTRGEESGVSKVSQVPVISIHSVTVLPALSKVDNKTLSECLGRPVGDNVDSATYGNEGQNGNMSTCLRDNGIPSVALVEDGRMEQTIRGGLDIANAVPKNDDCLNDNKCRAALDLPPQTTSSADTNSGANSGSGS